MSELTLKPPTAIGYHPIVHWLALVTAAATFPLIFMGGLVTSKQAGLAVPDWPTSFGYNMFALPWRQWIGIDGVFHEHAHRLLGSLVGFLSILLLVSAWWVKDRRVVRWLAAVVLSVVVLQGVLGGLRVIWRNLDLAVVHACLAQAFFCLATAMAVVTSRWWLEPPMVADLAGLRRLVRLGVLALAVIYGQLVLGALMRHWQAGLAIPDFPLNYGQVVPPVDGEELSRVNQLREFRYGLAPDQTLGKIWLHFAHRLGALAVTVTLMVVAVQLWRRYWYQRALRNPTVLLLAFLALQWLLGVLTVLKRKPADLATMHVATGALILMLAFVLTLRAARLYLVGNSDGSSSSWHKPTGVAS